jgi:hypothetical protein
VDIDGESTTVSGKCDKFLHPKDEKCGKPGEWRFLAGGSYGKWQA